ncbi:MAG TPA: hydantoinase/oxoprolinase family protein, partial [Acetobacteraceae bacterium]
HVSVSGRLPPLPGSSPAPQPATQSHRRIHLGGWRDVPVHAFAALHPDEPIAGPALVESDTTTVLLREGDQARMDGRGWLEISLAGA